MVLERKLQRFCNYNTTYMKKMLFTLAAAAAFTTSLHAQEIERVDTRVTVNRIRFGAYVAPNISWMRPTSTKSDNGAYDVSKNGTKAGFTYGLMAEYYFARNYAVVTGLQVNSTGGKINADRTLENTMPGVSQVQHADFDYRLQYLEVPVALKLRTDDINGFRFFGQLGLTIGFNIGKKANYDVTYFDGSDNQTHEANDNNRKLTGGFGAIAPVMLAMNIGAGAEYPINRKLSAYAGIFFNNGFTPDATDPDKYDVEKLGYKGTFQDGKTRLNNFALRIGLFF